jgi:hypothetical protein
MVKVSNKGLTLVEILTVVGIMILLTFVSTRFISFGYLKHRHLLAERDMIIGSLREARSHSMHNKDSQAHGFCMMNENYFVISGGDCRQERLDSEHRGKVPSDLSFRALPDLPSEGIMFQQLTGRPSWSGVIELSSVGAQVDIVVASTGVIDQ